MAPNRIGLCLFDTDELAVGPRRSGSPHISRPGQAKAVTLHGHSMLELNRDEQRLHGHSPPGLCERSSLAGTYGVLLRRCYSADVGAIDEVRRGSSWIVPAAASSSPVAPSGVWSSSVRRGRYGRCGRCGGGPVEATGGSPSTARAAPPRDNGSPIARPSLAERSSIEARLRRWLRLPQGLRT
jgi:hypothetical protein